MGRMLFSTGLVGGLTDQLGETAGLSRATSVSTLDLADLLWAATRLLEDRRSRVTGSLPA
jgi:hypothetical protein